LSLRNTTLGSAAGSEDLVLDRPRGPLSAQQEVLPVVVDPLLFMDVPEEAAADQFLGFLTEVAAVDVVDVVGPERGFLHPALRRVAQDSPPPGRSRR
jgi:hypothetical protein